MLLSMLEYLQWSIKRVTENLDNQADWFLATQVAKNGKQLKKNNREHTTALRTKFKNNIEQLVNPVPLIENYLMFYLCI